ncbi:MAG: hypothetical protein DRO88_10210 [Promethearchaeia archaeon]|nr:MAG: hypothetical protein DRO88_10210 [Candidatus Lokiarchaeia archaeon]
MNYIWIINKFNSTALFYRSYSELKLDSDLVSGLLTALNSFSEVELQSHGISSILMAGLSWVYSNHPNNDLLLIAAGDKDKNPEIMKSRLEVIYQMFMDKYKITPYELEETLIDQGRFADFAEVIDELHDQWKQAERIISGGTARMFDMLGIFQQIFNQMTEILSNYYLILNPEEIEQVHKQIEDILQDFQDMPEFQDYPELRKMEYNELGWNIVNLNPNNLEEDILQRILVMITVQLHNIIKEKLPEANRYLAYSKSLYSYLIRQYDLLHSLKINSLILRIFLT